LPITTFDLPPELLQFLDKMADSGTVRNRKEAVLQAILAYRDYELWKWNPPNIVWRNFRRVIMTEKSLELLLEDMSEEEQYEAGKRMGHTLADSLLSNYNLVSSSARGKELGFSILKQCGVGEFKIEGGSLVVHQPHFPKPLLQGYLESSFGFSLEIVPTREDVVIFKIRKEAALLKARNTSSKKNEFDR
jgi:hypothetical protein